MMLGIHGRLSHVDTFASPWQLIKANLAAMLQTMSACVRNRKNWPRWILYFGVECDILHGRRSLSREVIVLNYVYHAVWAYTGITKLDFDTKLVSRNMNLAQVLPSYSISPYRNLGVFLPAAVYRNGARNLVSGWGSNGTVQELNWRNVCSQQSKKCLTDRSNLMCNHVRLYNMRTGKCEVFGVQWPKP